MSVSNTGNLSPQETQKKINTQTPVQDQNEIKLFPDSTKEKDFVRSDQKKKTGTSYLGSPSKLRSEEKAKFKERAKEKLKTRLNRFKSSDSEKKLKEEAVEKYHKKQEHIEGLRVQKMKELFNEEQYFFDLDPNTKHTEISEFMTFLRSQKETLLHSQYDLNSTIQALISIISLCSAIASYEANRMHESNMEDINDHQAIFSLWICFGFSILLWLSIIFDWYIKTEIEGINKNIKGSVLRRSWKSYVLMLLEIAFYFLHPNPVFMGNDFDGFVVRIETTKTFHINSIFTMICFCRFFFVIKMYLVQSDYFCPRTARMGRLWGLNLETFYSLKANLIAKPYQTFCVLFFSILCVGSYTIRIFEVNINDVTEAGFPNLWNAIWCIFITMTTVGYGDLYPSSVGGRIIGILGCLSGAFLISLSVSTFTNLLTFENNEEDLCLLIDRIALYNKKEVKCKKVVYEYIRIMKELKAAAKKSSKVHSREEINEKKLSLFVDFVEFKELNKEINSTYKKASKEEIYLSQIMEIESTVDMFYDKLTTLSMKVSEYAEKYEDMLNIEATALNKTRVFKR